MLRYEHRFASQDKYKGKPDTLPEKTATGQENKVIRFQPKDFRCNDDNTATYPAGQVMTSPGSIYTTARGCTIRPIPPGQWTATPAPSAANA